jgi:hypothetical protein
VRDTDTLANLPGDERTRWAEFWIEVREKLSLATTTK